MRGEIINSVLVILAIILASSCGIKEKKSAQEDDSVRQEYLQRGKEIASLTRGELLKNVSRAMKAGGPGYAIEFCNTKAMFLKDSLSGISNCEIRRIAIKYRNPEDRPVTKVEKDQLRQYQEAAQNGEPIQPEVYFFDDRIEYYQPIMIENGTCLICHGDPGEQIAVETLEKIESLYPDDLATGFSLNDFRGAWKISFMK